MKKLAPIAVLIAISLLGCANADVSGEEEGESSSAEIATGALETWDGVTAHKLGAIQNVYARSGTDVGYSGGGYLTDTAGFQCVELAVRYMHFRQGITGNWAVGTAAEMCGTHPAGIVRTNNPAPGDLMVFHANDPAYGTGPAGHVAVVSAVGNDGTVTTFNQNWANQTTAFAHGIRKSGALCFLHSTNGHATPTATAPVAKPAAPSGCGALHAGEGLVPGQSIASCDKQYSLVFQKDSNLVLYKEGKALWQAPGLYGSGADVVRMQADGNLVAYEGGAALWSTRTDGHSKARLSLQNDGNLVIYDAANKPLWATATESP